VKIAIELNGKNRTDARIAIDAALKFSAEDSGAAKGKSHGRKVTWPLYHRDVDFFVWRSANGTINVKQMEDKPC